MSHDPGGPYPSPLATLTVKDLLEDVARGNLAPGGIGMAALVAAIGAVLVAFAGRLTAGKPGYEPMTEEMERIAERVKETREAGFRARSEDGLLLNNVTNMGTLGGATLDNEENYLIKKLFGVGLGVVSIENQARI